MVALLVGLLLLIAPPDSTNNLEDCLEIDPALASPPVTSLDEAREIWGAQVSVPHDTLVASLARVRQARRCYERLNPAQISRPYIGNLLRTYELEAELHAATRQFDQAFAAYETGLFALRNRSPTHFAGYEDAQRTWPEYLYQEQGYLQYRLGNLSASIESYLRAYRQADGPEQKARNLISVGVLLQRTQDYRSAGQYYERADRILTEGAPLRNERSTRAWLLQQQADLLLEKTLNTEFDRGDIRRARELAERGRLFAQRNGEQYAWLSMVLSESLGYLGSFERAYRVNREIRQFAEQQDRPQFRAYSLLKLGVLHIQTERWARADVVLQKALDAARQLRNLDYQRRILRALGRLHELQEDWRTAEAYYRQGVEVIEEYRSSLTASQWSVTAFAQWRDVHRGLVRALLAQDQNRDALAALDRSRARHLRDLRTQARVANQLPRKKRTRLDSLTRALTNVRNQRAINSLSPEEEAVLRDREAGLMASRQRLLQLGSESARLAIESIADSLAARNRALVSYFLDDPWPVYDRSPRSAAFILAGDSLRTIPLRGVTQDSVQARVNAVSDLFASRGKRTRVNAMHFDLRPLHQLHDAVYAPVDEHLPPDLPLTVVPDGPLFRVPLSMLVYSMPEGRYSPGNAGFVLQQRPIAFELATSLVATSTTGGGGDSLRSETRLAAFGVSRFDTLRTIPAELRAIPSSGGLDSSLSLPELPGVRAELKNVSRRVGNSRTYLDDSATEAAFWNASRDSDIVHLASHAFMHPTTPLQNAFLLHGDPQGGASDGLLFLHELQTRQQAFSLVVLSGCNTARGTLVGGEGMEGLQYAFRAMGTRSTVSSLWPVADRVNATMMDAFYRYLGEGLPKDEALRRAKLDQLNAGPEQASPFYWAPTVLYGSPRPVALPAGPIFPRWAWWVLAVGGTIAVLTAIWSWSARERLPGL